ncbi:Phytoene dehydrogenase-related protein [Amycolatopsis marina]|uniref:Pyridine nucleotide-disulfide oxidoreductase domain-containing protein 2 n=1 Tax=Amycolatopsis marina TaxID=490629 RepID=A0A1I0XHX4_9PSEU|nr:NAD(P)/FAD-dependent oxidoreductase [Amycolatopsis marina]SFB00612.1 Phytoene dehydrogenase-related protein [Amycolatopsis marina]
MSTDVVDAVVIGAGHNGLVAANLLADAGWQVLVLEAADRPGGAVHTADMDTPGFTSDLCSAFFPLSAASPVFAGLDLENHGLRWRHAPDVLAHVLPDDRCAVLSRDLGRTTTSLAEFASQDAVAWESMYAQWQRIRDDLMEALLRPFPPVRPAARLLRELGTGEALRLARLLALPARKLVEERFDGEGARLLLAGNAMHADLGSEEPGSGVFGWLLAMLGQDVGFPAPEGGAGRITDALLHRLAERGGQVRCGRRVQRVLTARGRAVGVRDASGELVRARHAVLADVPAPSLYLDLVGPEQLPARLLEDLRGFRWDDATVKVDWALSGPVPWTARGAAGAGTVHLGADLQGLSRFSSDLQLHRVPEDPFVLLGQMTTTDPTRSPEGTASVWAYTHVPHGSCDDERSLAEVVRRIEQTVQRHAPGFTDLIVDRRVQGPVQLEAHNANLVGGAINGGTAAIYQELFFRPVPGLGRADTPVDRLYLAGASAHPGGAVHGAPGANAARAALARHGLAGDLYARLIQGLHKRIYT